MPSSRSSSRSWIVGMLAFAGVWWVFDLLVLRSGVPDRLDDTWEYGVAARALLEGHPFRTLVIHPPLWTLRDAALTVPVLVHGPLVPLLLAPFLAVFGPHALDGIAWLAAAGAIAAIPPLVRLGERCGDAAIGGAAALVWTMAPLTMHAVHHDVALPIGAALLLAALELVTREEPRPLAAGLALGLACLARHELLAVLPLLALAAGARGWRVLGGALLPLLPWWTHNLLTTGQPLFNLSSYLTIGYWGRHPGIGVLRDFALSPGHFPAVFRTELPEAIAKWRAFFPHAVKRALLAPIPALGWLAALGALLALLSRGSRRPAALLLAVALVPIVVMTLTLYDDRYLVPFLPVFALGAARGARDLVSRMPEWARRPRAWAGLLVLVLLPAAAPAMREEAMQAARARAVLAGERADIARWKEALDAAESAAAGAPPGSPLPLFSDTPDLLAWTVKRPTVWLEREEWGKLPVNSTPERPARPDPAHTFFHVPLPEARAVP